MTRTKLYPRPNQIAELTSGVTLPLLPIDKHLLDIVVETILRAWKDLTHRQGDTISTGDEPEVSALLRSRLMAIRHEDSIWEELISNITRGEESFSYDGTHFEVKPDLSIYFTARDRRFPMRVECKIIDVKNQKDVRRYCKSGLMRFIDGRYGWDSQEAFMVAYVRDNSNMHSTLTPFLEKSQLRSPDAYKTERLPERIEIFGCFDAARSCHGRELRYAHQTPPNEPHSITLWHLWLPCQDQSPESGSANNLKCAVLPTTVGS